MRYFVHICPCVYDAQRVAFCMRQKSIFAYDARSTHLFVGVCGVRCAYYSSGECVVACKCGRIHTHTHTLRQYAMPVCDSSTIKAHVHFSTRSCRTHAYVCEIRTSRFSRLGPCVFAHTKTGVFHRKSASRCSTLLLACRAYCTHILRVNHQST